MFLLHQSVELLVVLEFCPDSVVLHIVTPFGIKGELSVEFRTTAGDDRVQHVLEVDFQVDAVTGLDIQMLHVGIDGHLAHLGMELEVEIETVVRIDRGCVGDLSFLEERQFQNDFFYDMALSM